MARRAIAGLRVIVTGASSGIGRALVLELLRQGAKVVALARREERLQELETEAAAGERFRWIAGDVTLAADRARTLELAQREFGGLDCLVNNAGIGAIGRFDEADEARLRRIMEVNLFAPAEFIREALPQLRSGKSPLIVNISSVLGHRAVPGKSEYCASKFAIHGLSDALRAELYKTGVDVLLVSPSTTESEFFERASDGKERAESPFGVMSAQAVAWKAVGAMRRGRREIILSASGKLLVWIDRLCPPLADWIVRKML
jgi:short-subunit dehydrogenase